MSPAISSNFRRSSTSIGSRSRKCCAASRSTIRPASRSPRPCSISFATRGRFNQGWATVEYTASALVDLRLHLDPSPADVDVVAFEREELARIGMPEAIAMRHRTPHFQHIFSGGYSAAYYSYLWSEVLDADAFEAFEEAGDIFDPAVAQRLHDFVYAAGGSRDYDAAYQGFRGRPPSPEALFRKRGFEAAQG